METGSWSIHWLHETNVMLPTVSAMVPKVTMTVSPLTLSKYNMTLLAGVAISTGPGLWFCHSCTLSEAELLQ